jgi:hypothetical protein
MEEEVVKICVEASNTRELHEKVRSYDIHVPNRRKRKHEHVENWSLAHLLLYLDLTNLVSFPIKVIGRESPDFQLNDLVGIEITEAISESYASFLSMLEKEDGGMHDPTHFKWGCKVSKVKQKTLVKEKKLTGPGWEGNESEYTWAKAILEVALKKSEYIWAQYSKCKFDRFQLNWLVIYSNLAECGIDKSLACKLLEENFKGRNWFFSDIFVQYSTCTFHLSVNSNECSVETNASIS